MIILTRKGGQKWLTVMVIGVSMLNFFDLQSRPALFVTGPAWFLICNRGERREALLLTFSKRPQMLCLCLAVA